MKAANYCVFQSYGVILLTCFRGPMTSLAWGPVGHCTSGRPLNPPLHKLKHKKMRSIVSDRAAIRVRNDNKTFIISPSEFACDAICRCV